ncbi:hypothetical protein WR25_24807 [Diploscapter pachys]|uniref:Uncharacterized protein n=1 Tax=Diploscapter pachys TaxID=2018661 RepID=A0A2A2M3S6_9BILA|nr:hypothetical protein WR25_24807 [Diploscapter pachys]
MRSASTTPLRTGWLVGTAPMKKVRRRGSPVAAITSRSSDAMSSPPSDQVHAFWKKIVVCRSRLPASVNVFAS